MPISKIATLLNFESIYQDVLRTIKRKFGYDLSYMKLNVSPVPVYTDGRVNTKMNPVEFGGCWTKNKTIYINPNIKDVMQHYKVSMPDTQFVKTIMAHELGHELYNNYKDIIKNHVAPEGFTTPYLVTVNPEKMQSETFCEYFAHQVTQ